MQNIWRNLALLFAGTFATVLGRLIFTPPLCPFYVWSIGVGIVILILYGSGATSKIWHYFNLWRSFQGKTNIGILNDMEWDDRGDFHPNAKFSPTMWKQEIEKLAKINHVEVKVKLISSRKNFDRFALIVNPYGGAYPEDDIRNHKSLNKILGLLQIEWVKIGLKTPDSPLFVQFL